MNNLLLLINMRREHLWREVICAIHPLCIWRRCCYALVISYGLSHVIVRVLFKI